MSVTIYHNPACGTSRNTLAMIRQSGVEPLLIDYRATPPTRQWLAFLIAQAGLSVREALRGKEPLYDALGLNDPSHDDEYLLGIMVAHPILINRPFVLTPRGVRLCRPSELVLDILANPDIGPFTKENGEVVIDANGVRLMTGEDGGSAPSPSPGAAS